MGSLIFKKKIHGRTFPQVQVRHIEATSMVEEVRPYLQIPAELDSIVPRTVLQAQNIQNWRLSPRLEEAEEARQCVAGQVHS